VIFAISDVVWQAGIAGSVTIVLAVLQYRTKQAVQENGLAERETARKASEATKEVAGKVDAAKVAASVAAVKVEEVKTELVKTNAISADKMSDLHDVCTATHILVNNNMAIQLALHATTARRLATITKDPTDIKMAEMAERQAQEHAVKQATVDDIKR
jgi:dihydrodipicolinate reductase